MVIQKYLTVLREQIRCFDPRGVGKYFLFGSATRGDSFHDIDLGVIGVRDSGLRVDRLQESLEDTTLPYFVDVVDFDEASHSFQDYVFSHEPIIWIHS